MDEKVIWAVSSGEYSDYRVNAVFSTKEKAEAYAARFNKLVRHRSDEYGVEEYPLDPEMPEEGLSCWLVFIEANGDIKRVDESGYSFDSTICRIHGGGWSVRCFARDREHAIKIAGERRQEEIAREALIPKAHPCSTDPKEGLR